MPTNPKTEKVSADQITAGAPEVALSTEHVEIMKHTRDRAAGGLYCGDSKAMRELVTAGFMESAGRKSFVPDEYFHLTRKGEEALARKATR